jgi:hypothetical protein
MLLLIHELSNSYSKDSSSSFEIAVTDKLQDII